MRKLVPVVVVVMMMATLAQAQFYGGGSSRGGYGGYGNYGGGSEDDKSWRAADPTIFGLGTMKEIEYRHQERMAVISSSSWEAPMYGVDVGQRARIDRIAQDQSVAELLKQKSELDRRNKLLEEQVGTLSAKVDDLTQRQADLLSRLENLLERDAKREEELAQALRTIAFYREVVDAIPEEIIREHAGDVIEKYR